MKTCQPYGSYKQTRRRLTDIYTDTQIDTRSIINDQANNTTIDVYDDDDKNNSGDDDADEGK